MKNNLSMIIRVLISALFLLSAFAKLYPTPMYGITKIFEDKGLHTRAAVSSNSLPLGVAVEVDAIFEIN